MASQRLVCLGRKIKIIAMKIPGSKILRWLGVLLPVVVMLFVVANPAHAAIVNCGNNDGGTPAEGCTFKDLFTSAANLVNYLLSGAAVVAVGGVVYGGYLMVTSAGSSSKTETGKKSVTNSMIGLAIILLAFLMVKSLFSILGYNGNPLENPDALDKGQGFQLINGTEVTPPGPTGGPAGGVVPSGDAKALAGALITKLGENCFLHNHVSGLGAGDGATAWDNVRDTSQGLPAKRSSYNGAPGSSVSLDPKMLEGLLRVANSGYPVCPITEFAGGQHVAGSYHYSGKGFDLDQVTPQANAALDICRSLGAREAINHGTSLHCAW